MINLRELRIGNLLLVDKYYWHVDTIMDDDNSPELYFKENQDYNHYINAEPIEITPELLERLGFKKGWDGHDRVEYYKDGFRELADYGSQVIVIEKEGRKYLKCGYYENIIDLDYIHQLQNLYFALTGEELELKDKWRNGPGVEKWDFKD